MEWIKKCPVFFLLTVSGVIFSIVGIVGSFSMYRGYGFQVLKQPFLVLMMEGIDKGVMPWEACGITIPVWNGENGTAGEYGAGQNIEDLAEADGEDTADGTLVAAVDKAAGIKAADGTMEEGDAQADMQEEALSETAAEEPVTYEFQDVTEDYFNDAVFIGDSRTVGLFEYGGIEERADFFAKISLTIYDVFTEPVAKDEETGEKITVEEALSKKQYGKVYLMLGINELGTGNTDYFMRHYTEAVEKIRQLQPDAVIFVEGIMRVTGEKSGNDPIFNNTNINEKNDAIATLADNRDVFYIDVNEVVCDENGDLIHEYTIDEIHLKAKYYEIWKEFLLKHGIVKEK